MTATAEIRALRKDDDRTGFSCGQPDLDRFFRDYAGQNQFKLRVAVTYLVTLDERIAGFATVTMGSIERAELPTAKLRRRMPAYPLPVLRLPRLGVDEAARGLGLGRALVRHVLRLALGQRDTVGCVGVLTDAKVDAVAFYERLGFEPLQGVVEGLVQGEPMPMFLPIRDIAAAVTPVGAGPEGR